MKYKTFTYNQIIKFFQDNNLPLSRNQVELIASKVREEVDARDRQIERRTIKKIKRNRSSPEWEKYRADCISDGIKPMSFDKWNSVLDKNLNKDKKPENLSRWNNAKSAPTLWDKIDKDPVFEKTLRIRTNSETDPTMGNR
jgi:hypothetical protein